MQSYLFIGGNHDGLNRMDKMKRKIALLFAALLLWTAMMSVARVVFDQELDATNLGVIISVGAIVLSLTALAGYLFEITQSKIALFFTHLLPWTSAMVFGRFISGQSLDANIIGFAVSLGAIFALFMVVVYRIQRSLKDKTNLPSQMR